MIIDVQVFTLTLTFDQVILIKSSNKSLNLFQPGFEAFFRFKTKKWISYF